MKCETIRERLNEYVDGTLPAQWQDLVREHVSTCGSCAQELESLKAYLEAMGSLDKVNAPDNFLQSVNERLKEKPGFKLNFKVKKDVMQKILAPFKTKLALKVAGTVVTVLFVVFIVKIMRSGNEVSVVVPLPKDEVVTERVAGEGKKMPLAMEKMEEKEKAASLGASSVNAQAGKAVELVLLIKPEVGTKLESNVSRSVAYGADSLDSISESSSVINLVQAFGGNIKSVKHDESNAQIISAEIPRDKYSNLLKSLGELKEFKKPAPSVIGKEGDSIKIRVKLAPSK